MKRFKITKEHLILAKEMNVRWLDCVYGSPCIDPKRPYGNKDVEEDICRYLGFNKVEVDYETKFLTKDLEYASKIHKEMETALQIFLSTLSFKVGEYECEKYGYQWRFVK